jgi:hypothetical protein
MQLVIYPTRSLTGCCIEARAIDAEARRTFHVSIAASSGMEADRVVPSGGYADSEGHGDIVIYARTAQGTVAHLLHLRGVDYGSGAALPAKPVHIRGWPDWLPRARPGHPAAPAVISKADTP